MEWVSWLLYSGRGLGGEGVLRQVGLLSKTPRVPEPLKLLEDPGQSDPNPGAIGDVTDISIATSQLGAWSRRVAVVFPEQRLDGCKEKSQVAIGKRDRAGNDEHAQYFAGHSSCR